MKTPALIFAGILAVASLASAIPNPAAEFCVKCGYKSEIRTDPQGGQYGVCVFPDGSDCEEWAFYRKCNTPQTCGDCNCPWPCPKRIIYVDDDGPADFNNIQAAIDNANDGDTIIVEKGIYFENINFRGKNIILTSTNPNNLTVVAATIIDGNNLDSVVTFASMENANCVLSGFTIQNGFDCNYASRKGGGISGGSRWNHTGATIRNNTITRNYSEGGGVGFPTVTDSSRKTLLPATRLITGKAAAGFTSVTASSATISLLATKVLDVRASRA